MRRRNLTSFLLFATLANIADFSEPSNIWASPNLRSDNDILEFSSDAVNIAANDSSLSRLDLYLKVRYSELQFLKADDRFRAEYEITIDVLTEAGEPIEDKAWSEVVFADSFQAVNDFRNTSLTRMSFALPPGEYDISINLKDVETGNYGLHERSIMLRDFDTNEMVASDILYLEQISHDEQGNYEFLPRVSGLKYVDSKLFAFFEIYNLPENERALVQYDILSPRNTSITRDQYWLASKGKVSKSYIEVAGNQLPHGEFRTRVTVSVGEKSLAFEKPFTWYWAGLPRSLPSLEEAIEVLKYVADKKRYKDLRKVSSDNRHQMFIEFWAERDPTPGTPANEFSEQYYQRIKYANDKFSGVGKDGWETDMGWVHVELGSPDIIERNPYDQRNNFNPSRNIKASEVWTYYKYNRQFVFIDEFGFGEFRLDNPRAFYDIIQK